MNAAPLQSNKLSIIHWVLELFSSVQLQVLHETEKITSGTQGILINDKGGEPPKRA